MKRVQDKSKKLFLFDIDYTLVKGVTAHKYALIEALKKVYGLDVNVDPIDHLGKTEKEIVTDILRRHGIEEPIIASKLEECISVMSEMYDEFADKYKVEVLDGVKDLLDELKRRGIPMGLITGNTESISRKKLEQTGLDGYFEIGGFDEDGAKRSDLLRAAIRKAEAIHDTFVNGDIFVFGDTPFDIYAGKEVGTKTIGVATSSYSEKQLKDAGADFVFKDLRDTTNVLDTLLPTPKKKEI
jgi:phosphoglycolate phosphatase